MSSSKSEIREPEKDSNELDSENGTFATADASADKAPDAFNVYVIDDAMNTPRREDLTEPVGSGLATGEIRQYLLDYFGDEEQDGPAYALLRELYLSTNKSTYVDEKKEAEEMLYDLTDGQLDGTSWPFASESLYVIGVDEEE